MSENVKIHVENLTKKYGDLLVLDDISFDIQKGEFVCVVGPTGCGKTTLVSMIPRLYDADEGSVLVDGVDVREYTLASLHQKLGYVPQRAVMFSGTITSNVGYGADHATEAQVKQAVQIAQAADFVDSVGYAGPVAQGGANLSGGQKQRISIARVFLKNPPILILDEATSALDNESERIVQQSLEQLARGRTTFTIAHRLTTIRGAQLILVLTEDGIAEQGTHAELMEKGGLYHRLYSMYTEM